MFKHTFKEKEFLFYIDLNLGKVEEGKFIEYDTDGIWLKLTKKSANTFVFFHSIDTLVHSDLNAAKHQLEIIRSEIKNNLLDNDRFIQYILDKLKKTEGPFYVSIIKEILQEKMSTSKDSHVNK